MYRDILDLGECGDTCPDCPISPTNWGREVSANPLNYLPPPPFSSPKEWAVVSGMVSAASHLTQGWDWLFCSFWAWCWVSITFQCRKAFGPLKLSQFMWILLLNDFGISSTPNMGLCSIVVVTHRTGLIQKITGTRMLKIFYYVAYTSWNLF